MKTSIIVIHNCVQECINYDDCSDHQCCRREKKKKNILLGPPLGLWEIFSGLMVDEEDKMCVIFIFVFRDQTHIGM